MTISGKLFGPSRGEIWRALASELGATYVKGSFLKRDRVELNHGGWTITLDTFFSAAAKVDYTRLMAPYTSSDGFQFTVYRRGLFSDLAKALGMQDVEVGFAEFDQDFIIKGTDRLKLRALFENHEIRRLIAVQPRIHFTAQPCRLTGSQELCFTSAGVIKDLDRLKTLFDLFAETLDHLCAIGSAGAPAASTQT